MSLTNTEMDDYYTQLLIPNFMPMVDLDIMSVLYDINGCALIATNKSARSIGFDNWQDTVGLSYSIDIDNKILERIFSTLLMGTNKSDIEAYFNKILSIQNYVCKNKVVINYIDFLPYQAKFNAYYVSCIPVFHPSGVVVAFQTYTNQCNFLGFHDYLSNMLNEIKHLKIVDSSITFTHRETEILFLLTYGVTQDEIAHILGISRGTVATIISKQLCAKFGIQGSNTKSLTQLAINKGFHKNVPSSLMKPNVMVINHEVDDLFDGADIFRTTK